MGGLLFGPSIGAFGVAQFGGIGFVFVFSAVTSVIAAAGIALRLREEDVERRPHATPSPDRTEFPPDAPYLEGRLARDLADDEANAARPRHTADSSDVGVPLRLLNRGLIAAIFLNIGGYFGSGTYEVIWSLYLEGLGADLALIGLTFAMFGLPVLLLSPLAGRMVDKRGPLAFIVLGMILPAMTGIAYTLIADPWLAVPLILIEATGFALLNPALYAVVAANSPPGRSSTAQGIYGAAGTFGFIIASLATGVLAAQSILYPFYLFSAVMVISLVVGISIGRDRLRLEPARAAAVADRGASADLVIDPPGESSAP
jgi:Major Facilitator Superfamily